MSSSTERKSFILDDFGAKNTKSFVHASEMFLNKTRFLTKFKGFWRVLIQADPNLINIPKSDQNVYFLKHFRESLNYVERFVFCQKWEPYGYRKYWISIPYLPKSSNNFWENIGISSSLLIGSTYQSRMKTPILCVQKQSPFLEQLQKIWVFRDPKRTALIIQK